MVRENAIKGSSYDPVENPPGQSRPGSSRPVSSKSRNHATGKTALAARRGKYCRSCPAYHRRAQRRGVPGRCYGPPNRRVHAAPSRQSDAGRARARDRGHAPLPLHRAARSEARRGRRAVRRPAGTGRSFTLEAAHPIRRARLFGQGGSVLFRCRLHHRPHHRPPVVLRRAKFEVRRSRRTRPHHGVLDGAPARLRATAAIQGLGRRGQGHLPGSSRPCLDRRAAAAAHPHHPPVGHAGGPRGAATAAARGRLRPGYRPEPLGRRRHAFAARAGRAVGPRRARGNRRPRPCAGSGRAGTRHRLGALSAGGGRAQRRRGRRCRYRYSPRRHAQRPAAPLEQVAAGSV